MARRTLCETALLGLRDSEDDDGELAEISDLGASVERLCDDIDLDCFDFEPPFSERYYARREREAKQAVACCIPSALATFNAILDNVNDRQKSIAQLAKRNQTDFETARRKYYRDRDLLLEVVDLCGHLEEFAKDFMSRFWWVFLPVRKKS